MADHAIDPRPTRSPVRSAVALLGVLILLLGLSGCTGGRPVTRSTAPPATSSAPPVQPEGNPAELATQKAAAKIADCPVSTAVEPVDGGLPAITLSCLGGGRPVRLAGLRGQPLVINIWGQWCPPCREEAPYLAEVAQQTDGAVQFLGVDYTDPYPDKAIDFAQRSGLTYPQMVDPEAALQVPLGLPPGIPVTLFVRADGTIAHTRVGPVTSADQLRQLITSNLGV